jgi:FkbM family methyltransferase
MSLHREKLGSLFDIWDNCGGESIYAPFVSKDQRFAIYGAGANGRAAMRMLKREFGTSPVCFMDQHAASIGCIGSVGVLTPDETFEKHGDIAVGVAVLEYACGGKARKEITDRLKVGGFTRIHDVTPRDAYDNDFLYIPKLDREKTLAVTDLLYDTASKEQYYAYIYQRMWKTPFFAPSYPENASYSATDLFRLGEEDHILDCGAYTGDTIRQFLSNFPNVKRITAFEPDIRSYEKCRAFVNGLTEKDLRIDVLNSAVSDRAGTVAFDVSDNLVGSRMDENLRDIHANHMKTEIRTCRIDSLDFDVPPSLIKMDVEGAESEALAGAAETIRKHHPILAISIYHRAEDIYAIPMLVRELYPDYRLFVRKNGLHYATWDFQLFAVPHERLL